MSDVRLPAAREKAQSALRSEFINPLHLFTGSFSRSRGEYPREERRAGSRGPATHAEREPRRAERRRLTRYFDAIMHIPLRYSEPELLLSMTLPLCQASYRSTLMSTLGVAL